MGFLRVVSYYRIPDPLLKFYKSTAVAIFLYGSECWILNKQLESRTEAHEMGFPRAVACYRRTGDIRN
jgi:hypothetical protein